MAAYRLGRRHHCLIAAARGRSACVRLGANSAMRGGNEQGRATRSAATRGFRPSYLPLPHPRDK